MIGCTPIHGKTLFEPLESRCGVSSGPEDNLRGIVESLNNRKADSVNRKLRGGDKKE